MATVNKDFKIKSGLIVEGTNGKINNYDILTKKQDDQDYIVNLIGGTATPDNTPDTVVKRDGSGNFAAQTVTVEALDVSGVGTISDDGELLIAAATGEDIRLSADDVRVNAVDDFRVEVGGDILLQTTGVGNNVYVGSLDTGNEVVVEATLDAHIGDVTVDGTAGNTVYDRIFNAKAEAIADAGTYTDDRETAITTAYQSYADQAELDAVATAAADATTKADQAELDANSYTDARETAITSAYQVYADQAEADAKSYTDTRETAITSAYQSYADTAEQDAKNYADGLINDASNLSTEVWSAYKTSTEISLAQQAAEDYADQKVADLVDSAPALLDTLNELAAAIGDDANYATTVSNMVAAKADTTYVDQEIADAIQSTTYTAGTNIDITDNTVSVTGLDTDDVAEGTNLYFTQSRARTSLSSGVGIDYNDTNGGIGIDRAQTDTWYDANGSALTAENNAKGYADSVALTAENNAKAYADGLAVNYDAAGSAAIAEANANTYTDNSINALDTDDIEEGVNNLYFTDDRAQDAVGSMLQNAVTENIVISYNNVDNVLSISAENGVADSTTSDLAEGSNLYFTDARAVDALEAVVPNFTAVDLNSVAKQVAATTVVPVAGIATAYSWAKADYRSAEFLVKVAYGTHTEISKVLLTLDTSDNIAITEYAIVGTNGSASSVSAVISGNDVQLQTTTVNNTSTVTVVGTLLA
jgi:hypothetical protein